MKKNKAFTLVELLAVIAILAIILLIAVPSILGVIEEAKVKSFKLSVLGIFDAIELEYAVNGTTNGDVSKLPMNPNPFTEGNWSINEDTGEIIITDITDGQYEVNHVTSKDGEDFDVNKNGEPIVLEITINGKNPDTVSCSATESYQDQGAKYKDNNLTTEDTVNLAKAGTYLLKYQYEKYHATRVVNITNTNQPTLNIKQTAVTITKGDQFNPSIYIDSASDPCEGDITEKVQSISEVNTDVGGNYTVTYRVRNLGGVETTKTMEVTVVDLSAPEVTLPETPSGNNGWFGEAPEITLTEDTNIDGYEYAISTDGGTTWGEYQAVIDGKIIINQEGNNIYIKIRGKRGDKYTDPVIKGPFKVDLTAPTCVSSGGSTSWVKSLTLTGTCSDTVSGCVNPTVTKLFNSATNITNGSPGTVRDNAGHTTTCPSNQTVKVDTAKPGAPTIGGGSTTWTAGNRTFTATAPTSASGIKHYEYFIASNTNTAPTDATAAAGTGLTISKDGKFIYFRAVNNVGTKGNWTAAQNLYRDTTKPGAPTMNGASTTWTTGNRTFTVATAPSSASGIKHYEYYILDTVTPAPTDATAAKGTGLTISQTGKFVFFRAVNNAGTKGTWTAALNLYVDKTTAAQLAAPKVTGASTTWAQSRTFTMTAPSSVSGIKMYEYVSSSGNTVPGANPTLSGSSTTTSVVVNKTGKFVFFRAVNNAGVKGAWTAVQNAYVDIAAPTLTRKTASYSGDYKGSYPVTNLYTVTYGASGGSTTCKVGSTTVTNLNSLAAGSHTLSCTATSGAGKVSTAITVAITLTKVYLVDRVKVGDFVNYNAGTWTSTAAEPTSQGGFGGYTSGKNKSASVTCDGDTPQYSGWRVLNKSGSGASGTVTLVHAGQPECYYRNNDAYAEDSSTTITNLNNRAKSQYVNSTYATSARSMTCNDLKAFDNTACTTSYPIITNDLIKTGSSYYTSTASDSNGMWSVWYRGDVDDLVLSATSWGLRPVVTLKSGILKTGGAGTNASPYNIGI